MNFSLFENLPVELLTELVTWLRVPDFVSLTSTCESLFAIQGDESLWRYFFSRDFYPAPAHIYFSNDCPFQIGDVLVGPYPCKESDYRTDYIKRVAEARNLINSADYCVTHLQMMICYADPSAKSFEDSIHTRFILLFLYGPKGWHLKFADRFLVVPVQSAYMDFVGMRIGMLYSKFGTKLAKRIFRNDIRLSLAMSMFGQLENESMVPLSPGIVKHILRETGDRSPSEISTVLDWLWFEIENREQYNEKGEAFVFHINRKIGRTGAYILLSLPNYYKTVSTIKNNLPFLNTEDESIKIKVQHMREKIQKIEEDNRVTQVWRFSFFEEPEGEQLNGKHIKEFCERDSYC